MSKAKGKQRAASPFINDDTEDDAESESTDGNAHLHGNGMCFPILYMRTTKSTNNLSCL
jgi:hypothetical protein